MNNQVDYKNSFKVVLDSFLSALKYLFKSVKHYASYMQFCLIQLFASLFVLLTPFACKANYGVTEKIMKKEEYELLVEYKGISGLKKYLKFFLLNVLQVALILGVIIAVIFIVSPLILVFSFEETLPVAAIIGALAMIFALLIVIPLFYSANYIYSIEELSLVDNLKKSINNGKSKASNIVLANILLYILNALLCAVPMFLIIDGITNLENVEAGVGILLLIFVFPIVCLTSNLVQLQLIKQLPKEAK